MENFFSNSKILRILYFHKGLLEKNNKNIHPILQFREINN